MINLINQSIIICIMIYIYIYVNYINLCISYRKIIKIDLIIYIYKLSYKFVYVLKTTYKINKC